MEFDKIISITVSGVKVRYGILVGNSKLVFIKSGSGGSHLGEKGKYLRMAHRVRQRMGATVICASNPEEISTFGADCRAIRYCISDLSSGEEIYFFGASDGAYTNLALAARFPQTVKLVGVNSSFIDFVDFVEKLRDLPRVDKVLVYGTEDEDGQKYLDRLHSEGIERLDTVTVQGADHSFKGKLEEYIALIDLL